MRPRPAILGGCAAALLGGAVAGSSIDTTPLARAALPVHAEEPWSYEDSLRVSAATPYPDHYPLVTPAGRIEVEDLIWHGRLREEREAAERFEREWAAQMAEAWAEEDYLPPPDESPTEPVELALHMPATDAPRIVLPPVATGGAKSINVEAAMAARAWP